MTLDVDRRVPSPNFRAVGWYYGKPKVCVIHSTRSGIAARATSPLGHVAEMSSTLNWFGLEGKPSAQLVVNPFEIVRCVGDEFPSHHAKEHSWQAYGVEVTQPTRDAPYYDAHYERLQRIGLHYVSLGVAPVHLTSLKWGDKTSGFIGHEETAQGRRDGKSDPNAAVFDWDRFIASLTTPTEDDDMALSDEDIDRIAVRVIESMPKRWRSAWSQDWGGGSMRQIIREGVDSYLYGEDTDQRRKQGKHGIFGKIVAAKERIVEAVSRLPSK